MAAIGTMTVTMASEEAYKFSVYPWDTVFNPVGAIYVITKCTIKPDGNADHLPIYVGYTDDLSACFGNHHRADCFKRHGANCVCVLGIEDEQLRSKIKLYITGQYNPVCND